MAEARILDVSRHPELLEQYRELVLPHLEMTPIRDQETPTRETVDAVIEGTPAGPVRTSLYVHGRLGCRIEALERLLVPEVEDDGRGGRARLDAKGHDRIVR